MPVPRFPHATAPVRTLVAKPNAGVAMIVSMKQRFGRLRRRAGYLEREGRVDDMYREQVAATPAPPALTSTLPTGGSARWRRRASPK
jgi:hypothetical protein